MVVMGIVVMGIWNVLCVGVGGGIWGRMVFKYNIIEGKYGNKIRGIKIACGVGGTDSDFFRSDLLKNIKTTPLRDI